MAPSPICHRMIVAAPASRSARPRRSTTERASPKRKTVYRKPPPVKPPIPRRHRPRPYVRPTVAEINTAARHGRTDLAVGDRVRIIGAGSVQR